MTERLTTLAAVKDWLGLNGVASVATDTQLTRLIDAASQFVLGWLNNGTFGAADYVQNFKGNGKSMMLLKYWPVLSISSVGIAGSAIVASTMGNNGLPGSGYTIGDLREAPQSLDLWGYYFNYGAPSQVSYRAGYETSQDIKIAVDTGLVVKVTPNAGGQWCNNTRVLINGALAIRDADATPLPSTGHYYLDEWGVYTFSVADVGKTATITYSYVPWDASFGVVEMIGEWYKMKDHIGMLSKTLGGQETITFSQQDLSPMTRTVLQRYMNVVPI